ncbi:MAG: glycosyltransferase [Chloroflexi bacterium]|nr:glycosyltransferase [Chloroflexota bacterium]
MKLLFVTSSLDLTQPFSATPAWWQLFKGLYEHDVEVIAAPYQGPSIESLWWRAAPNPARWQGDLFLKARQTVRRVTGANARIEALAVTPGVETWPDKTARQVAQATIAPLWWRQIDRLLCAEPDIDAVIFLTVPLNHLVGVAAEIQQVHKTPVLYYDGDVPASLPQMQGFASGFRIYQGADLSEYAAFISNSDGGAATLKDLGARAVHTLYYGADPDVFAPVDVPAQDIDVLFYGHGREYRADWIDAMIKAPSQALPQARFAVRGTKLGDLGRAETLPYLSFSKLREYAARTKINLCITRAAHANTPRSSSSRPFELAAMGCCIVSNPYDGIEAWFEPGKEIFVVGSAEEAVDCYRYLLDHEHERRRVGAAARQRVLAEHTFQHRAGQLIEIVRRYI